MAPTTQISATETTATLPAVATHRDPPLSPPVVLRGRDSTRETAPLPPSLLVQSLATAGLALVIWLTLYLALARSLRPDVLAAASFATAVWVPCLQAARRAVPQTIGPAFASVTGTAVGIVLGSAIQSWLHFLSDPFPPSTLLVLATAVFFVATVWWHVVDRVAAAKRRVMIVGTCESVDEVAEELADHKGELFEVIGAVDPGAVPRGPHSAPTPGLAELAHVLDAQRPDLVVVADDRSCEAAIGPLLDLGDASPRVVGLSGFFEHAFGRVPVGRLSATWFMSLLHLSQRPHSRFAKRLFDVAGAALGLVLTAPVLAITALLIRRSPGPVIYRQVRVGQRGKLFEIYKFRTMRADAEEPGCSQWACADDPRATSVGRVLRRTHIDELPQLWNVLRGDMSLVGPRPERPDFLEELEEAVPFWSRRLLIKPGITGWAQLHSGYAADVDGATTKLSYDLWYLRHRNVLLDLAICVKTISSLLAGSGR
jgi:exopolysaccharide biosynthesis polyprenyl glycosylphosphotransferase